jgi:hypothetical protein
MVSQWQVQAAAAAVPENQKHQGSVCYGSFGIRGSPHVEFVRSPQLAPGIATTLDGEETLHIQCRLLLAPQCASGGGLVPQEQQALGRCCWATQNPHKRHHQQPQREAA